VNRKFRVIAGPYRVARKYALSQGWPEDEIMIVTRGHQLANLDPALIASIITVKLHTMGARIITELRDEIERICTLWPQVRTVAAA
jgi:hypothetical protein